MNDEQIVEEVVSDAPVVDKSISVLSSGVEVRFKEIPTQIVQKVVSDVMGSVKRDGKNNITFASGKEIQAIRNISKYYDILILMGVDLVKPVDKVATSVQLAQLEVLAGNEIADDMKAYYFLRYFGFVSADDFALLTEKTVNITE